jgi:hypothetical protein
VNEGAARLLVRSRSAGTCELCAGQPATNWSHRKSRGQGGLWAPSNGLDLCGSGTTGCHGWLTHEPLLAAAGGWQLLRDNRDPATVPVWLDSRLAGYGWWLLDDQACFTPVHPSDYELPVRPELPPWARLAA